MIRDRINQINLIIAKYPNFQFAVVRLGAVPPGSLGRIILFFFQCKLETFLDTSHVDDKMKGVMVLEISSLQIIDFLKISKISKISKKTLCCKFPISPMSPTLSY